MKGAKIIYNISKIHLSPKKKITHLWLTAVKQM